MGVRERGGREAERARASQLYRMVSQMTMSDVRDMFASLSYS